MVVIKVVFQFIGERNSMKIGIVGDLHIAPPPEKRIDDYFQVGLNKIEEIAKNCDIAIFLGDIFTNAKVDEKYVNKLIRHLDFCKNMYKCNFKTIIGNHDVSHEEESNLDDSSLGTLYSANVMGIITPENPYKLQDETVNYRFNTIPVKFKNAKEYIQTIRYSNEVQFKVGEDLKPCIDILLVHHEYETGTNCFSYNDFKDLGCKLIFLGHDHKPFDAGRIIYPEFTVYRSGSIMRNRADDYNLTRQLYYYILENGEVSCQAVTTSPSESVFKVEAINKIELQERKYTEAIDNIIQKYENNISSQDKFSIKSIMNELNAKPEIIDYIKKQYDKIGEVFA